MLLEIELNYYFGVLLYFCYLSIMSESVFLLPVVFLLELRLCPVCVFSNTTRQLSCDCLPGGSIRSYWLMLSPIRLPSPHPLQIPIVWASDQTGGSHNPLLELD